MTVNASVCFQNIFWAFPFEQLNQTYKKALRATDQAICLIAPSTATALKKQKSLFFNEIKKVYN